MTIKKKLGLTAFFVFLCLLCFGIKAQAAQQSGFGEVTLYQEITEEGPAIRPPEITTPEILPPEGLIPGVEPLQMTFISPIDFGVQAVVSDNKREKAYPVNIYMAPRKDGEGSFGMPHFLRFRDLRISEQRENFYTIKAAMTSPFTNGNKVLQGDLYYSNVSLVSGTNAALLPDETAVESSFKLLADGSEVQVLAQKEAGKGYGIFELMFGTYEQVAESKGATYEGIQLVVPGEEIPAVGAYQAVITWTLEDAP